MIRALARSGVSVGVAVVLALVGTSIAYAADDLISDGDGVTPVTSNPLTYGTVCKGASGSRTVAFQLRRAGSGGGVFANSAVVSISLTSAPAGVTGGSFGTITVPSNWATSANGTLSASTTGVVTIDTSAVKTYSGTLTFSATAGGVTRTDSIALSATVSACDTTPPVLTLPSAITAEATSASGAVVSYTATATDAVDGARPVTCSKASGTTFALGTTTVSCSASDTSGNTATGSFGVTVQDTTAPALTLPPNQTREATGPAGAAVTFTATATDLVDGARPVSCTPSSGATFALGTTSVSCSASDLHGNTGSGSFSVLVRDTTAPTLTLPSGVTAEATGASGAAVTYAASASDTVDTNVPVSCDHPSGSTFPLGGTVVHCSASDDSGNPVSGTFTVTVGDSTAPVVNVPVTPVTVEATGPTGAVATYSASAHDTVSGDLPVTCTPSSGSLFALGSTTVQCSATDGAGNPAQASFEVHVVDTTAPDLTLPSDTTLEATSTSGASYLDAASAHDLVDGDLAVDCDHAPGTFGYGVTVVSCSVTDAHGNTASGSYTVTVVDTTEPVITLPDHITIEATGPTGAGVTYDATAYDTSAGVVPVTCAPVSGSVFALGTATVSCAASDGHGNTAHASFPVTVEDTTAPTINVPPGATEEATSAAGATVTYVVTADDLVDTAVAIACSKDSGTTFPLGTTTVTCTATDDSGNHTSDHFDVHVQDTTAPHVGVPADATVEATGPDGAAYAFAATATDAVSSVSATCTPDSGATFPLGLTTVHCSATDDAGNTGDASFTVNVVDTTPPVITPPAAQLLEATSASGAVATYSASATDLVDGAVPVTCSPASGSTFPLGDTTVHCSASDTAGNPAAASFHVVVQDTTPPALHLPDNIVDEATAPGGNLETYSATATDLVDGAVPVTCTPPSGSTFAVTTTTVSCHAEDSRHNGDDGAFTVSINDSTAPAIHLPDNATVEATGPAGAAYTYTATAHDTVDGDVTPTCGPASGATFPLGPNTVTCHAADLHGNESSAGFTVTVVDTTKPVLTLPADKTLEATGPAGAAATYTATAHDTVSGDLPVTCTPPSGSTFALGTTTVNCSATDGAGNTQTGAFHVTVVDTTAPVVTVPANKTVEATGPSGASVTFAASASDTVSGSVPVTCNPASGATFPLGLTTVTCTASDGAGNPGSSTFTVNVVDTTKPVLTLPASFGVIASTAAGALVTYPTSATDTVSGSVPVTCTPASGAAFGVGSTPVGCSATDGAGNTATGGFTVRVRYAFSGFLQPVNDTAHQMGATESKFKLGSTVPLKFTLGTLGSSSVQQTGSPAFAKAYRGATCDTSTTTETTPDTTSTTGTVYRWDTSQYIFNFSTKGLASGEYRVYALTADGAQSWVDLCLTK